MLTRNLALSVAAAALLSASALPAMAANPPLFFDFSIVYNDQAGSNGVLNPGAPYQTITGIVGTDNVGNLSGYLQDFKINGVPHSNPSSLYGSFTPSNPGQIGYQAGTTYTWNSFGITFTPNSGVGMPNPTTTLKFNPFTPAGANQFYVETDKPPNNTYYQIATFTPTALPEIDGGVLPKALFVVAGAFLMFFGRKKTVEV